MLGWRLAGQRDLLHVVADLDLVNDAHALNHAAEDRVLAVQPGLRLQADIELAAAALPIGVHVVAGARRGDAAAQMLFLRIDFGDDFVAGTAGAVALGVAALDHEAFLHAMEGQAVVKALVDQLFEVLDRLRSDFRIELDYERAVLRFDDRVMAGVAGGQAVRFRLRECRRGCQPQRQYSQYKGKARSDLHTSYFCFPFGDFSSVRLRAATQPPRKGRPFSFGRRAESCPPLPSR